MRKKLVAGLLVLGVVLLLVIFGALLVGGGPTRPALPNPNGFDDLVKAGQAVTGNPGDYLHLSQGDLDSLLSDNAAALRELRVGLNRQCLMPLDKIVPNLSAHVGELGGFKRLAQLLCAEGQLALMNHRSLDAGRSYLDALRLGNQMSRGGLLITRLVGIACEAMGCRGLAALIPQLSPADARVVMVQLEKIDAEHVTWPEVRRAERSCALYHVKTHLNPVLWLVSWWQTRAAVAKAEMRNKTIVAQERLLLTELALRCYQSERGAGPARLDDLVTNYLSKVPGDPFGSGSMVYHPAQNAAWIVYSVGPDGIDDGGKSAGRGSTGKGDILLDSLR
jgi:hypothetical protein